MANNQQRRLNADDELTINMKDELNDLPPELDSLDTPRKEMLVVLCHLWPNIAAACRTVGVSRQTFYNWKDSDELFAGAVAQLHESRLDNIETKVHDWALSNTQYSLTACIFLLNTQRSDRFQSQSKVKHEHTLEIADPMDMARYALPQPTDTTKEIDITPEDKGQS